MEAKHLQNFLNNPRTSTGRLCHNFAGVLCNLISNSRNLIY